MDQLTPAHDLVFHRPTDPFRPRHPRVVCLCGSTRFWRTFGQAGLQETMAGRIVLSIGAASGTDDEHFGNLPRAEYDRVKQDLDCLHMHKIDMAGEVLILNVDGYVGESTRRELAYALATNKQVRWWEPDRALTLPDAELEAAWNWVMARYREQMDRYLAPARAVLGSEVPA